MNSIFQAWSASVSILRCNFVPKLDVKVCFKPSYTVRVTCCWKAIFMYFPWLLSKKKKKNKKQADMIAEIWKAKYTYKHSYSFI